MPELLPPLHQSMVETAACPRAYVEITINGKDGGISTASERGSEIHHVMAQYVEHCTRERRQVDWIYFDKLTTAAGPEAGPILDGLRNSYIVHFDYVYGTEMTLALDEEFRPTRNHDKPVAIIPGLVYSEEPAAHAGTLDVTMLSSEMDRAKIDDYKSHPAPFEADTYQSVLYSFMVFKHFPQVNKVTFELIFVRYRNQRRSVVWKREDMPEMQARIARARARQRLTHAEPEKALALPCKTCTYCPLAKSLTCPIADWNEHTLVDNSDRLRAVEFYRRMGELHRPVLKAHAAVNGPISYRDGNGVTYTYGETEVPETRYPVDQTSLALLATHKQATGEDLLDGRLVFSSTKLKALLKTKKREGLREAFEESSIETATKPQYRVRSSTGETYHEYNPYRDDEE